MNKRLRQLAVDGFPGKTADKIADLVYGHDTFSVIAAGALLALSVEWPLIASPLLFPQQIRRIRTKLLRASPLF